MATTLELQSWGEYVERLRSYNALPWERKRQLIFRGQGDERWSLTPTIDRLRTFDHAEQRERFCELLLSSFRSAAAGLGVSFDFLSAIQFETLARHHGLPTALLDWTMSPYMAAYFAFDSIPSDSRRVAIWIMDRGTFADSDDALTSIVLPGDEALPSVRAIEQQGVVVRLYGTGRSVDSIMTRGLVKFTIPASDRRIALQDLESMGITARSLFRDLDGAARTVTRSILEFGELTDD